MEIQLPYIPERPSQPRETGLTMMMDKGLSLKEAEAFIEKSAHLTDLIKLGFGTAYVSKNLTEKIKIYKEAGMKVYFGGTLFEAFIARGKFDDYRRMLDNYDIDTAEVSDGSIVLNHDKKCELISTLAKDKRVLSEVGSKEEGILISPAKWIKMMQNEIEAGSWKVIAEGRESGSVGIFRPNGTPHTILINKIISKCILSFKYVFKSLNLETSSLISIFVNFNSFILKEENNKSIKCNLSLVLSDIFKI
jgi:phosphosulfolactate synthase